MRRSLCRYSLLADKSNGVHFLFINMQYCLLFTYPSMIRFVLPIIRQQYALIFSQHHRWQLSRYRDKLRADSILGRGRFFFYPPQGLDWLWGISNLLSTLVEILYIHLQITHVQSWWVWSTNSTASFCFIRRSILVWSVFEVEAGNSLQNIRIYAADIKRRLHIVPPQWRLQFLYYASLSHGNECHWLFRRRVHVYFRPSS
jgi:hypothetical protein